MLQSRVD